ncbi:uncharacterized protein VDAG_02403 [Verticillium dahliae VdLs.17]|uniref:Uncharacterized protein n=1 Tax=Verticillium dahliae (strain VdLs.17 / ATCC MYA-4575 / FGSC 10137) TaxID=498257 RepID=G2WXS1_VERDV|nr:uncharacterized protein VDAG_02403 [Verticillium dahliae VdLs.17]EGY20879.1 hypothetical protein VDAG_02403 [Verticillium dahliae VdLs.17]
MQVDLLCAFQFPPHGPGEFVSSRLARRTREVRAGACDARRGAKRPRLARVRGVADVPDEVEDFVHRPAGLLIVEGCIMLVRWLPVVKAHRAAPVLEADLGSAELDVQVPRLSIHKRMD